MARAVREAALARRRRHAGAAARRVGPLGARRGRRCSPESSRSSTSRWRWPESALGVHPPARLSRLRPHRSQPVSSSTGGGLRSRLRPPGSSSVSCSATAASRSARRSRTSASSDTTRSSSSNGTDWYSGHLAAFAFGQVFGLPRRAALARSGDRAGARDSGGAAAPAHRSGACPLALVAALLLVVLSREIAGGFLFLRLAADGDRRACDGVRRARAAARGTCRRRCRCWPLRASSGI